MERVFHHHRIVIEERQKIHNLQKELVSGSPYVSETCNSCDRNIPSTDVLQARRLGKRLEGEGIRPRLIKLKSEMTKR